MHRNVVRILLGAAFVVVVLFAPTARQADAQAVSACPAMTDSIERLYRAYFERSPDQAGFDLWVSRYQSGEMSLAEISQSFANSSEFAAKGLTSDQTFVLWVYRSLAGREATPTELSHWERSLGDGYPRGSMMLTFSESSDYVRTTRTEVPLAGYRRWYPKGSHWYCNTGAATVPVKALIGSVWADFLYENRSDIQDPVGLWTVEDDGRRIGLNSRTMNAAEKYYNWDGQFKGDGDYGRQLEVKVGRQTDWVVVFYPNSIGTERLGWQLS